MAVYQSILIICITKHKHSQPSMMDESIMLPYWLLGTQWLIAKYTRISKWSVSFCLGVEATCKHNYMKIAFCRHTDAKKCFVLQSWLVLCVVDPLLALHVTPHHHYHHLS